MISTTQRLLVLIAVLSLGAVGLALISQYMFDMQPCAWCVLQRLIYLALAVVCLVGAFGGRVLAKVGAALAALLSLSGVWAAFYQYTVASKLLSCNQTFADKFISGSGLDGAIPSVFGIYATCMDAVVSVLGLEYSLWSLILFVVCVLLSILALFKRY
jgi:disulfide bond formation protein DsbB